MPGLARAGLAILCFCCHLTGPFHKGVNVSLALPLIAIDFGALQDASDFGEFFVLRELEVDQPGTNYKHPKANKSRDEKRAAWRNIGSGF